MWRQIRRVLAQPILRGDWPPGTRMPAELELTERFGASRMTVSKAVQSLASEGLVQRRRKLGTVVADRPQERPVFEIWDIADLVTRAGGAYSYKLLACEQLKRDPDKRELLGVSPRTPTLSMLCLHLCNGEPYQLEERLVNIDAAPGITCRPLDEAGPGPWLVTHVPWTDAEHKISAQEAPPAIAAHLKVRTQAACLVVDRRTWNETVPVTYARLWHAGNQHSLVGHFQPTR
jgi:GntR family histidine utilization transcriptional repressor